MTATASSQQLLQLALSICQKLTDNYLDQPTLHQPLKLVMQLMAELVAEKPQQPAPQPSAREPAPQPSAISTAAGEIFCQDVPEGFGKNGNIGVTHHDNGCSDMFVLT